MSTATLHQTVSTLAKRTHVSWIEFQQKYLTREDGYKYEWLNGEVEKTKITMDFTQLFILKNLMAAFRQLLNNGKCNGELMSEGDIFFLDKHRRPDIFYLTDTQIARTAYGENQVPQFVIEVISTKDQMNSVHRKMQNYRDAGVQVVWHIFPQIEEIHVYKGENLDDMTVCRGKKICSAAPVLPDLMLAAQSIFHKPPKPI
jgi:Uma2 family endonuclease